VDSAETTAPNKFTGLSGKRFGDYTLRGVMNEAGKFLVMTGLLLAVTGALFWSGSGRSRPGRLPGDINCFKDDFSFHFPVVTGPILSAILKLLRWLFRK
jgi:hypothetical protein